jgi:hypothetical protein
MKCKNFLMCLLAVFVVLTAGLFAMPSSEFKGDFKWVKYDNKDCGYSMDCPQVVTVTSGDADNSIGLEDFLYNCPDAVNVKTGADCTFEARIFDGSLPVSEGNNVVHFRVYVFRLEECPEKFRLKKEADGDLIEEVKVNGKIFTHVSWRDSAMGMTCYNDLYIINAGGGTSWCVNAEYFFSHRYSGGAKEFRGIGGYGKMNRVFMRMLKSFRFSR